MWWIECSDSLETTVIGNTVITCTIIINSTWYKQDPQSIHMLYERYYFKVIQNIMHNIFKKLFTKVFVPTSCFPRPFATCH